MSPVLGENARTMRSECSVVGQLAIAPMWCCDGRGWFQKEAPRRALVMNRWPAMWGQEAAGISSMFEFNEASAGNGCVWMRLGGIGNVPPSTQASPPSSATPLSSSPSRPVGSVVADPVRALLDRPQGIIKGSERSKRHLPHDVVCWLGRVDGEPWPSCLCDTPHRPAQQIR